MRGRWRGLTSATRDRRKTSVCTCEDALGRHILHMLAYADIHVAAHLQEKSTSCIIHAECKLILKYAEFSRTLLLLPPSPTHLHFFSGIVPLFHLAFICILFVSFAET